MRSECKPHSPLHKFMIENLTKICKRCGIERPITGYPFHTKRGKYQSPCLECRKVFAGPASAAWRKNNPEPWKMSTRKTKVKLKYGLTLDEINNLLVLQDYSCAICDDPIDFGSPNKNEKPHIDHDHVSGKVRGLLCLTCNTGLGMFRDSRDLLGAADKYLQSRQGNQKPVADTASVRADSTTIH